MRRTAVSLLALAALCAAVVAPGAASADDPGVVGAFSPPFSENGDYNAQPPATPQESVEYPTAVSMALLPKSGNVVYWNGLEGLETTMFPLALDATRVARNSRSRLLDLDDPEHPQIPSPENADGSDNPNDNDLFCADQRVLLNGDVLAAGGTIWVNEPVDLTPITGDAGPAGTAELLGNPASRVYHENASGGTWVQGNPMNHGRWYPTLLTLPDGRLFVASGVGRLLYNDKATNVHQTEIFNPWVDGTYNPAGGTWTDNGASGEVSLPLFARLHLIHDATVLYDGVGQVWGPFGQSYDQALWNVAKSYDPATNAWTDRGIPGFGALNGALSVMLPFTPDADGNYSTTRILHAGGTIGTSPGGWLATNLSEVVTISGQGKGATFGAQRTGDLNNRRWYSSGVLTPTGEVLAFSGADSDEVVFPGIETAVRQVESFNVATGEWTPLASSARDRTYHNSAILLPDGRVLVGGHSPINFLYGGGDYGPAGNSNAIHSTTGLFSNNMKDPSFEIFSPPYLFRGPRPQISNVSGIFEWGTERPVGLGSGTDGADITKAVLMRVPSTTHVTDADARSIEVPITNRTGGSITVEVPTANVAPPGYYYLFVLRDNGQGPTPSVAATVRVGTEALFSTI